MSGKGALQEGRQVSAMFDRIAPRYDLMNRIMTGRRDVAWRHLAAKVAVAGGCERALDVATGTGDLAIDLREAGAAAVVGLDFSPEMLEIARQKAPGIAFVTGDAMAMPFDDGEFDACTVAFGLRNMEDYQAAVSEMARILKPGGRFVCLELTPYRKPVLGRIFGFYFKRIMPVIGGLLSGDRTAYQYLPASVDNFPDPRTLAGMMDNAGLTGIRWKLLGGGTVALHVGIKPEPDGGAA
jgi:demethylmenaquinone methyltransferase/2-methoxy-6-polyprenyl-1,4-benzoquinol methylase